MLFLLNTRMPWQAMSTEAFHVSGSSCWRHLRQVDRPRRLGAAARARAEPPGQGRRVNHGRVVVDSQSVRAVKGEASISAHNATTAQF